MDAKVTQQLEEARAHFRARRLLSAYPLVRRYFDRLPFEPEPGHGEWAGMFIRILLELGKHDELKFYVREFERAHNLLRSPYLAYAMAVVYCYLPEPSYESARVFLESIVRDCSDPELRAKAKIQLAWYYDTAKNDVATCRLLIDSIEAPESHEVRTVWKTWKARVLLLEQRFPEAEELSLALLREFESEEDWYPYCIAALQLAYLHQMQGALEKSRKMIEHIRGRFNPKQFRSLESQLKELERRIEESGTHGTIYCERDDAAHLLTYKQRSLRLKRTSPLGKLLKLFAIRRRIDKAHIVRALYAREYSATTDDKLIYYHIHCLRKSLMQLGVPKEALQVCSGEYRLLANIEYRKGME